MKNAKNAKFCMFFSHFSGGFWEKTLQKRAKNRPKKCPNPTKKQHFCAFWGGARIFPTGSRLVPDWFPKFAELDDFLGFGKCFGGGVRGVVLGWLGRGFGGFGKVSGDFW